MHEIYKTVKQASEIEVLGTCFCFLRLHQFL